MKVWFGCTTVSWKEYREYYFAIRDELVKLGCIILYDWIDYADQVSEGTLHNKRNPRVYQQVTNAIAEADIVVVETTVPNFSTAHQINFSLLRNKPTLVLRLHKDKTLFNDSYLESMSNKNLKVEEYRKDDIAKILKSFVSLHRLDRAQKRYNIVLENKHKYYLDWLNQKKNASRSAIIRNLIDSEMESDDEFLKYLDNLSH